MIATMPVSEAHNHHAAPPASPPISERQCDCAEYQSKGVACSCSLNYASKLGKRAVERLFHKSVFFQEANIEANIELQTEAEAAKGGWKNMDANKVVQVAINHVQVGKLLGQGGFCLVHDVAIILPNDQKVKKELCVKFLKPIIFAERKKLARGIADLAIEAHFLATLNHPHILKIRGVAEGIELFQPTCPNLTNQPGTASGYFLILDKMHTTLDKKIEITWKNATEKYNSFLYRTTHDLRGIKRKGVKTERLEVALQLAQAMQYLHQHNIVYRDLKPDNIGFDENNLKLFDFGLAKELKPYKRHEDGTYHLTANTGSRRYMAPVSGENSTVHVQFSVEWITFRFTRCDDSDRVDMHHLTCSCSILQ